MCSPLCKHAPLDAFFLHSVTAVSICSAVDHFRRQASQSLLQLVNTVDSLLIHTLLYDSPNLVIRALVRTVSGMTGHARYVGHQLTPASATEVSASLNHVCGTLCRRLCDNTLATYSLSDNNENISASELDSHGA